MPLWTSQAFNTSKLLTLQRHIALCEFCCGIQETLMMYADQLEQSYQYKLASHASSSPASPPHHTRHAPAPSRHPSATWLLGSWVSHSLIYWKHQASSLSGRSDSVQLHKGWLPYKWLESIYHTTCRLPCISFISKDYLAKAIKQKQEDLSLPFLLPTLRQCANKFLYFRGYKGRGSAFKLPQWSLAF